MIHPVVSYPWWKSQGLIGKWGEAKPMFMSNDFQVIYVTGNISWQLINMFSDYQDSQPTMDTVHMVGEVEECPFLFLAASQSNTNNQRTAGAMQAMVCRASPNMLTGWPLAHPVGNGQEHFSGDNLLWHVF